MQKNIAVTRRAIMGLAYGVFSTQNYRGKNMEKAKEVLGKLLGISYGIGNICTFIYLTFFDGYVYNWWNWIIAVPVNGMLGVIWPIYWFILKPIFGY